MTARQKSFIWVPIGIASLMFADFIIQIDPTSFAYRMIALLFILKVGMNIKTHYQVLAVMEKAGRA